MNRFLCWLMWQVNTDPWPHRERFYELKDRLLRKYGRQVGTDWQHIVKKCWTCDGTGCYQHWSGDLDDCLRCHNGIYDEFWVELERWEWCGRIFHRPARRVRARPMVSTEFIEGRIQHERQPHAREAYLWLTLLCDRSLFWRLMRSSWVRSWMPLSLLNRFVFACRYRLGRINIASFGFDSEDRLSCGQSYDSTDIPF